MIELPADTADYIDREVLSDVRCLVVAVDAEGIVKRLDNPVGEWSVAGLRPGEPLPLELGAVNGSMPRDAGVQVVPLVYVGDAGVMDVHVLTRDDGRELVLYDVTRRHEDELKLQQKAHQISLLLEKQAELNRELDIQRAAAEEASEAKSRFIASMSHEFRTPISAIIGYVDMLAAGHELPDWMDTLQRASWHLVALVENLLEHARDSDADVPLNPEPIDVDDLLKTMRSLFLNQAESRGLVLRFVGHDGTVPLETDGLRLKQVLINLLGNAIRYTPSGSVELAVQPVGDRLRFRVSDTGPGIGPDDQQRIFEPFTRLDPEHGTGAGLGLAISRKLVRAMGGDLRLDSLPGQGTTFSFDLPLGEVRTASPLAELSGRKALVVDDDPDILDLFELLLSDWGLDVTRVSGVQQARNQADRAEFDLLLTDYHLEDGTGTDIMKAFRFLQPQCRLILCSGAGHSGRDREAAGQLADEVLSKPVQPEHLKRVVERVLVQDL